MKNAVSILIGVLALAAAYLIPPKATPPDPADTFAHGSVPMTEAMYATAFPSKTCDNPLCTCDDCKCVVCKCAPLRVGNPDLSVVQPPDRNWWETEENKIVNADGSIDYIRPFAQVNHRGEWANIDSKTGAVLKEPPPGLIVPVAKVAAKKQAAPTGHWETVSAGFRGRRSYQVWVADTPSPQASPSCANGSCSVSGGCASCGRGRR